MRAVSFKIFRKTSHISVFTIYFHELDHSEWFGAINFFSILDHSKFFKHRASLLTKKKVESRFFPDLKFSPVVANLPNFHFWAFWQNPVTKNLPKNLRNCQTVFLYWIILKFFFQKSGRVRSLRILSSNFWPKISKIVWQ